MAYFSLKETPRPDKKDTKRAGSLHSPPPVAGSLPDRPAAPTCSSVSLLVSLCAAYRSTIHAFPFWLCSSYDFGGGIFEATHLLLVSVFCFVSAHPRSLGN